MFNIYPVAKYFDRKTIRLWRATLFICSVLYLNNIIAQPFSYIYIQGDKATPFYVKTEGQMQPRYGKNHCIISSLAAGRVNIEILFQQNEFPPEQFTVDVPENGHRGFLLDKQEHGFALYDLKEKNYIKPNDK